MGRECLKVIDIFRNHTILFLNLFPDYREPGVETNGEIEGVTGKDYENFAEGVINLIKAIKSPFNVKCIITWGDIPFRYIKKHCPPDEFHEMNLNAIIKEQKSIVIMSIPLIPLYHPSSRHYNTQTHTDYIVNRLEPILKKASKVF